MQRVVVNESSQPGRLHVITDEVLQQRFGHVELARLALLGGADVVQYREKRPRSLEEHLRIVKAIVRDARGAGASVIVNDHPHVAVAAEADGVHLGRGDMEPEAARRVVGSARLIGGTANSYEQALRVAARGVDYLGVGPVYGTVSKTRPAPRMGLETLHRICRAVACPVVAVGGIGADRVREVLEAGVHGVAVLSAVALNRDPERATRDLRSAMAGGKSEVRVG